MSFKTKFNLTTINFLRWEEVSTVVTTPPNKTKSAWYLILPYGFCFHHSSGYYFMMLASRAAVK